MLNKFKRLMILINILALSFIVLNNFYYSSDNISVSYDYANNIKPNSGLDRTETSGEFSFKLPLSTNPSSTINTENFQTIKNTQSSSSENIPSLPLDLNSATKEELMLIPNIGDVTSTRIVQYREYIGGYSDLNQLKEIKGIGEKTFEEISDYLYISNVMINTNIN